MSTNSDVMAIFPIYSQFGAVRKLDTGRIVCKTYIFINSNLLSYENWKQLKNLEHSSNITALSKNSNFAKKCWFFAKKYWHQENILGLGSKEYIFWNYICLCTYVPNFKCLA